MVKPLFRWTVGNCLPQGLEILAESIQQALKILDPSFWDFMVCYNGLNRTELTDLKTAIGKLPVSLFEQKWGDCPIPDNCQTPRRADGSYEWNGSKCGGTLWKVCPARVRPETHEIVMDNDIVLLKRFPQIDEFLLQTDKGLILEEPIRFYGRYDLAFPPGEAFLNSGFMGFPPDYDFGKAIFENWKKYKSLSNLSQGDEQGLLMRTLSESPNIRIKKEQMVEILRNDYASAEKITLQEEGLHFTQANRMPNHPAWRKYKELKHG